MNLDDKRNFEQDIINVLIKHKLLRDDVQNFVMGAKIRILITLSADTIPKITYNGDELPEVTWTQGLPNKKEE